MAHGRQPLFQSPSDPWPSLVPLPVHLFLFTTDGRVVVKLKFQLRRDGVSRYGLVHQFAEIYLFPAASRALASSETTCLIRFWGQYLYVIQEPFVVLLGVLL